MGAARARVRLMNEYAVSWPLWWDDGGGLIEREELALSDGLRHALAQWAASFHDHFDPYDHWDSPESRQRHADLADAVVRDLRSELGPGVEVRADLWELGT